MSIGRCSICFGGKQLVLALQPFAEFQQLHSYHLCMTPVAQIGPSCGIAALSSALSVFKDIVKPIEFVELLNIAKKNQLTLSGELFYGSLI